MPQGYALRNKDGCPSPAEDGGSTWNNFHTCCPPDTYNKPNQYNTICRQGVNEPTLTQCANTTWDLYAWNNPKDDEYEFFCCLQGLQGVYSKEQSTYGFFGCFNETDVDDDTMGSLDIRVTGKATTTTSASTTTTSTSSSSFSTILTTTTSSASSPTASGITQNEPKSVAEGSSHSTNKGAIIGGAVGGVCGAFLIGILIWLLYRYRSRTAEKEKRVTEVSAALNPDPLARTVVQSPRELPSESEPSELSGGSVPTNRGQQFGFYEFEAKTPGTTSTS